ncbi:alkyl hydroperoxide reductase subunit F [Pseudoalteromonas tunicata]|uniref:Alkyl hydroperoxide reductase subunit F n=1 Tax=Pseudoalteromonas tunicata D2 TaxID=87626 RepID=A4C811_9GAMM|nr:alkyl hydroperoxide reductase subunit F [Pseudoalteromonas tunicata]ATC93232.1 alkyl hydroperoxide reductase subunit F [Pseudoalteromonas tunicata]AXT32292.1 alkyl hydroperoxide reductase subunit F [Pseudoalteromonas tunicata]EAR28726.1 Alkyl hydroperoxide reductase subunit F [Pseudoalteromonas tunicata D2]MDP4985374.1 alkyl hydroperoxide reductase subunit F [Pseudoalteromonas tunicata]MDP5212780.1 alkyl hydroperoxide reductase subunit F [Pseudoalteromonas tunicata]
MLDAKIKTQLQAHLNNITKPIQLVINLDESKKSIELQSLANELSELNSLVSVSTTQNTAIRAPQLSVLGEQSEINFAGVPMGHEFTSLILALLHTGGHATKASAEEIEQISTLTAPLNFEIYISLSCQTCPAVVQALNLMAAINPAIKTTMIDGALFQNEVQQRNILSVPAVYLNGQPFSHGAISLADILAKLDKNHAGKVAKQLNEKEQYDVLIVGGGPAGAAAAVYAARKGLRTGLVAERFGGQVSDTLGIENFLSVKSTQGPQLVAQLEEHVKEYDVDLITAQKAKQLNTENGFAIELESGAQLQAKSVILATGARWREMNVPGEQQYRGKGVAYCPHCDGPLFKNKKVAVIGGGNSGIEAAIDLANIVEHVTVLEFAQSLRADAVLIKKARSMGNITIITQAQTTEVVGDGNKVIGLNYRDHANNEEHHLALAGIFVQIGLLPNTDWLKGTVELSQRGEIITNSHGATSIAGVFAAGDVTNTPYKQIIIAIGSGATASLGAFDYLIRHDQAQTEFAA